MCQRFFKAAPVFFFVINCEEEKMDEHFEDGNSKKSFGFN